MLNWEENLTNVSANHSIDHRQDVVRFDPLKSLSLHFVKFTFKFR